MLHDIYCKTYPVAHVKPFPLERARKNLMVKHEHDSIVLYAKKKLTRKSHRDFDLLARRFVYAHLKHHFP